MNEYIKTIREALSKNIMTDGAAYNEVMQVLDKLEQAMREPVAYLTQRMSNSFAAPGYETCEAADYGAFPVFKAAPPAQQTNEWREAVLDKLAEHCIDAPIDEPPATILGRIIEVAVQMATDPRINAPAQQAQPTDFHDEWTGYLKDGETPFERFLRERKDLDALMKLYQRALEENERTKTYQQHKTFAPSEGQFCFCGDEISLQIVSGGAAPEGLYGRVTLKVNGEYVDYVKATSRPAMVTPTAQSIGDIATIVDAAQKKPLEDIVGLCEQIRYMVGIAERGSGSKCPDDMAPEVFLLNYVKQLEAKQLQTKAVQVLEFVARHKSSDWPERCQQMVDAARSTLAEPQQAGAVPSDVLGAEWVPCIKRPIIVHVRNQRPGEQHVSTREGITPVKPDDLIMRGVSGEEYPIGRAIFEQTYDIAAQGEKP